MALGQKSTTKVEAKVILQILLPLNSAIKLKLNELLKFNSKKAVLI